MLLIFEDVNSEDASRALNGLMNGAIKPHFWIQHDFDILLSYTYYSHYIKAVGRMAKVIDSEWTAGTIYFLKIILFIQCAKLMIYLFNIEIT